MTVVDARGKCTQCGCYLFQINGQMEWIWNSKVICNGCFRENITKNKLFRRITSFRKEV